MTEDQLEQEALGLFVNGLPLVLIELKNPADQNADVWKALHQIQTYKEQTADVFQYNEVLVISDGTDAMLGSLSADSERLMAWRTIDGVTLNPLGPFNELQFEDDGAWSRRSPAATSSTRCARPSRK